MSRELAKRCIFLLSIDSADNMDVAAVVGEKQLSVFFLGGATPFCHPPNKSGDIFFRYPENRVPVFCFDIAWYSTTMSKISISIGIV